MSELLKDGGPAFPSEGEGHGNPLYHSPGMSLRDWYAGMAMQGIVSGASSFVEGMTNKDVAVLSYSLANAMIRARGDYD